jgi:hypothetical protein
MSVVVVQQEPETLPVEAVEAVAIQVSIATLIRVYSP